MYDSGHLLICSKLSGIICAEVCLWQGHRLLNRCLKETPEIIVFNFLDGMFRVLVLFVLCYVERTFA